MEFISWHTPMWGDSEYSKDLFYTSRNGRSYKVFKHLGISENLVVILTMKTNANSYHSVKTTQSWGGVAD